MGSAQTYLWLTIIPLAALVVVARYRLLLVETDRHSYRHIASGLSALALASLMALFRSNEIISFGSDLLPPLAMDMVIWIATIVGAVLTSAGISQWLPLSREYRRLRQSRVSRLELLRVVEQLVAVEDRPRRILIRALEEMIERCAFSHGRVYKLSRGGRGFNLVHATMPREDTGGDQILVSAEDIVDRWIKDKSSSEAILEVPQADGSSGTVTVLPIRSRDTLYGLFVLHPDGAVSPSDDKVPSELVLVADIVARKILLDRHRLAVDLRSRRNRWRDHISSLIDERKDFKANLSYVADEIMRTVGAEFLSVAIVIDRRIMHRFSTMLNGSLLQEAGLNLQRQSTHVAQVLKTQRMLVVKDIQQTHQIPIDDVIRDNGMRSLIAVPVERLGGVVAALSVASRTPDRFQARERGLLRSLSHLMASIVGDEVSRSQIALREKSLSRLELFIDEASDGEDDAVLFQKAADVISEELSPTVVRISTYEDGGRFLRSRSLDTAHEVPLATPPEGLLISELLPYHRLMQETGRIMMINQASTDKRLDEAEAELVFCPDVKSVLLVPVKCCGRVTGCVSLADVRAWERNRYRHIDVLFVRSVAGVLGVVSRTGPQTRISRSALHPLRNDDGNEDFIKRVRGQRRELSLPYRAMTSGDLDGERLDQPALTQTTERGH